MVVVLVLVALAVSPTEELTVSVLLVATLSVSEAGWLAGRYSPTTGLLSAAGSANSVDSLITTFLIQLAPFHTLPVGQLRHSLPTLKNPALQVIVYCSYFTGAGGGGATTVTFVVIVGAGSSTFGGPAGYTGFETGFSGWGGWYLFT